MSHYNGKKQLLQKNQEEMMELKHSLEVKEQEVKAMQMEKKLLQLDLDRAQSNEKKLKGTVASLEAQVGVYVLYFSDCTFLWCISHRSQRKMLLHCF